jgi:hypothetical protein
MKTLALLVCALISSNTLAQLIYVSEVVYPSFSFLSNNEYCISNEDYSLFNDTLIEISLLSQGREGFVYFAYSSVLGGINDVNYEQIYQGETISFDNYVFAGLNDTIRFKIFIQGSGIESFCPFFLPLNPLAVLFGKVECYQYGGYIIATCQTLSETNSKELQLQVSADLIAWSTIQIKTAAANSSNLRVYSFITSAELSNGIYYAKFVEVDFNGSRIESETISFEYKSIQTELKKYDLAGRQIE